MHNDLIMKFISASLLFITLFGCSQRDGLVSAEPTYDIEIIRETRQSFLGRPSSVLELLLTDEDLPARRLLVRITESDIDPKGALILNSGGFGTTFYGIGLQTNTTINFALSNGLQVFEIRWDGQFGWGTDLEGAGYTLALRGYTRIVEWLRETTITNTSLVIANGGSGGSMQIAYGLANHNLEPSIDHAILMAGPPSSDLKRAVFGDDDDIALWPSGIGGFGITDYIHGWRGNGDYCAQRTNTPPEFVIQTLEAESIVNNDASKTYHYDTVTLYFVNTDDVTNADQQGLLYHDAVTSAKQWIYLPEETSHDVGGIEAGASAVRTILNSILN